MEAELTKERIAYRKMMRKENGMSKREIASGPNFEEINAAMLNKRDISLKVINTRKSKSEILVELNKIGLDSDSENKDFIFEGVIRKSAMKGGYEKEGEVKARLKFTEDNSSGWIMLKD